MFKFKKDSDGEYPVTTIGQGMRMDAKLISGAGVVRIEGEYCGEIYIDGELILEKSGHINGGVNVKIAYVSGTITGNVKCSDLLHVTSTGKIAGDIECAAILMDEGALFTGYSKMTERRVTDPADLLGLDELQ